MSGHFRVTVWDPWLIISQILCIQASFYFALGALLVISGFLFTADVGLVNIFSTKALNFTDRVGVLSVACYLANSLFGSLSLWYVVKRTKQCLDFSVTCYFLHLLLCWMYNGSFPSSVSWWLLTVAGVTIMCVCAEFLCLRTELDDIPLLGGKVEV